MKLYIKFMIGSRSIEKLEKELSQIGIPVIEIDCGVVKFPEKLNTYQSLELDTRLPKIGFEILDPVSSVLLDRASALIKELVYEKPQIAISDYPVQLEEKLKCDELKINHIFSQVHGVSICQSARLQQVERIKELILYEDLNLNQVAEALHLKDEVVVKKILKEITGLPPSFYQKIRLERNMVRQGKEYFEIIEEGICLQAINVAN